ncbi:hypothetical protein [Sphingomonas hankookensis]
MRLFGLIDMGDAEWKSIVADVVSLCDGKLPCGAGHGLQAA